MEIPSKIGFHAGPAGNMTGIGDFMRRLDRAGIPFFLKSTDQYGVLFEAAEIAAGSGVPHTLIYRISTRGQEDGFDYDVPAYDLAPDQAARRHWERIRHRLPPEFDPARVWIEPINEVDHERSDWLGRFAVNLAEMAHDDGYRVTLFGWSSGEPEREDWETPGMLDYLRLCAARPGRTAVAVHEYDHGLHGFEAVYPYHVGRFQILFDVCDQNGIARPTVHVTEWGWAYDHVPGWEEVLPYIRRVGALYALYPQIKGAAIWTLGRGATFGNVHNEAQRLIAPLAEFTLTQRYTVSDAILTTPHAVDPRLRQGDRPPIPPGEQSEEAELPSIADDGEEGLADPVLDAVGDALEGDESEGEHAGAPEVRFLADVTVPDDTRFAPETIFTKTWLVANSGTAPWRSGFQLRHVGGEPLTEEIRHPVRPLPPGGQTHLSLVLRAPGEPGRYVSDWRLFDEMGVPVGDILFTRIQVEAPDPTEEGQDDARFVADITVPDDSRIPAGSRFVKTWRVTNSGQRLWGAGYQLIFAKGHPLGERKTLPLPLARPGEDVEISLVLQAPERPGTYFSDWRLHNGEGEPFGDTIFVRIIVH